MTAQAKPSLEDKELVDFLSAVQIAGACSAYKAAAGDMAFNTNGFCAALEFAIRAAIGNLSAESAVPTNEGEQT
jgi:hypothetical protein